VQKPVVAARSASAETIAARTTPNVGTPIHQAAAAESQAGEQLERQQSPCKRPTEGNSEQSDDAHKRLVHSRSALVDHVEVPVGIGVALASYRQQGHE